MNNFKQNGYAIESCIYTSDEIEQMQLFINQADTGNATFRKTKDLFAIRQVLKEIPQLANVVFNDTLRKLISEQFGEGYFVSKSIYFDKPANSNWFVAYHQDLTISVKEKAPIPGYGPFTTKQDQFAVQPPLTILENNFTIRIHLDDTNEENGALRVIPGSHLKGIQRADNITLSNGEDVCEVAAGGVMLMHPLLLHASGRSTGTSSRRVLHIEFSNQQLPEGLSWSEYFDYMAISQ
ncbi:phytanoyl-CoA dioxygenase family protein [Pseudoflavitalea sp. G-6-1-2]|uniref:phytanoyl-CoA dioxygenase family protein n=1 Tax=Pseudoflavitalea sp. G-6-1-2 TaxID=2728841 RepID=UPI00146A600F|nr:phytanoyl-CoA dioxygenase family protein [Pseudoflavitalea sp. G-6-1-2]NML20870.1 phytanoyl-CoA dioxygenase family protein [Pseudoflavitalea sp. G-6-1-2]